MHKAFVTSFIGMATVAVLVGCQAPPASVPANTPAAAQAEPVSATTETHTHTHSDMTESKPAPAAASASAVNPFYLSEAQFVMDTAGFHGIAESLADTKQIDASTLTQVQRVQKVLSQAAWPAELNPQATAFLTALGQFATALSDGKVDDAIKTSDATHEAQHELSHAIDHWLTANAVKPDSADAFNVSMAQFVLDSAGFHGIAESLAETKQIDAGTLTQVQRVQKVLSLAAWPAELNPQATAFLTSLGQFATALSDGKVDDAIKTSEVTHDTQHELSHAIDHWLTANAVKPDSADAFNVSMAQFVLDTAGFHGIAESLAETKQIDAGTLTQVQRVQKVLSQAAWPAELNPQATAFLTALGQFATALSDGKVDDAIKTSEATHDTQHELSHAIDHMLQGHASDDAGDSH